MPPAQIPNPITQSYNGTYAVFRRLRCIGWGPELLNLGYFPRGGLLGLPANLLVSFVRRQQQLVINAAKHLAVEPEDHVIDIACGRGGGSFTLKCVTRAARVSGIDLLPENVRLASDLFPQCDGLEFSQGNAQDLPFESATIDRAFCCEAAFHFPDKPKFLQEVARVLKPGGRLVVVDIVWNSPASRQHRDHELARHVREVWQWDDLFAPEEYRSAAEAAGLRLVQELDWTKNVTEPLQDLLEFGVWMRRRPWGRRAMNRKRPLTQNFTDQDWDDIAYTASAHRFVQQHSRYKVFVFDKPK